MKCKILSIRLLFVIWYTFFIQSTQILYFKYMYSMFKLLKGKVEFKSFATLLYMAVICLLHIQCNRSEKRILVFSKTMGFRHASIAAGKRALLQLGADHKVRVDTTEDARYFCEDSLQHYSAIVFLSTTGDILNWDQQIEFMRYIQAGGGYVGIHAASDTEYGWEWYTKLVGANFESHPKPQKAKITVLDGEHPSTKGLPTTFERTDEWYNFKNFNDRVHVLATIDEHTYEGGKHGKNHPMVWYHEYDGGRAFYTEFGHTEESYKEELFLKHVWGGV